MKKTIFTLAIAIVSCTSKTTTPSETTTPSIVGSWTNTSKQNDITAVTTITFSANGDYLVSTLVNGNTTDSLGTYSISGSNLTTEVKFNGQTHSFKGSYAISDNTLTITSSDGKTKEVYTKK